MPLPENWFTDPAKIEVFGWDVYEADGTSTHVIIENGVEVERTVIKHAP